MQCHHKNVEIYPLIPGLSGERQLRVGASRSRRALALAVTIQVRRYRNSSSRPLAGQTWLYNCLQNCFRHFFGAFGGVTEARSHRCFSRYSSGGKCDTSGSYKNQEVCVKSCWEAGFPYSTFPDCSANSRNPRHFDTIEGGRHSVSKNTLKYTTNS